MKMRILTTLLAAIMLLTCTAIAADTEGAAPAATSDSTSVPTESVSPTTATVAYSDNSPWFDAELAEANALGLIPARFAGESLRETMTRAEFAAVALLTYEKLSGGTVAAPDANPFSDTSDTDVLRAYAANIGNGVSEGVFAPNELVSRQQTATMLTRIFKATHWYGWTLAGDSTYTAYGLDYESVTNYADDGNIDDYAYASVYFLTKYDITNGTGNNLFEPDAGCTREQGIALALRLYKAFG